MTATRLAASAGVSKSFISQLETGRTSASIATLERIADALGVTTGHLLARQQLSADSNSAGEGTRLLHSRQSTPAAAGLRVISDVQVSAHAIVTIPPRRKARGRAERGASLLVAGLHGSARIEASAAEISIGEGEVAVLKPAGEYFLLNDGPVAAAVLTSARSIDELPELVRASSGGPPTEYGTAGPLRLVTMRARRAAERLR
jgi:transcriptional regulator with XRE-family HTH domain